MNGAIELACDALYTDMCTAGLVTWARIFDGALLKTGNVRKSLHVLRMALFYEYTVGGSSIAWAFLGRVGEVEALVRGNSVKQGSISLTEEVV